MYTVKSNNDVTHNMKWKKKHFVPVIAVKHHSYKPNTLRKWYLQTRMYVQFHDRLLVEHIIHSSKGTCKIFLEAKSLTNYAAERLMRTSVPYSYLMAGLKMHYTTNTTHRKLAVPEIISSEEHLWWQRCVLGGVSRWRWTVAGLQRDRWTAVVSSVSSLHVCQKMGKEYSIKDSWLIPL